MSKSNPRIRILVCRVGRAPAVEYLEPGYDGSYLDAMQKIVGGYVEFVGDVGGPGLDVVLNEDGIGLDLPLNRIIPGVGPALPAWVPPDAVIKASEELCDPGEAGEWRILGDFFFVRGRHGEVADVTDEDVARWTAAFESEDVAAAKETNDARTQGAP
jgi:hypothetical protein